MYNKTIKKTLCFMFLAFFCAKADNIDELNAFYTPKSAKNKKKKAKRTAFKRRQYTNRHFFAMGIGGGVVGDRLRTGSRRIEGAVAPEGEEGVAPAREGEGEGEGEEEVAPAREGEGAVAAGAEKWSSRKGAMLPFVTMRHGIRLHGFYMGYNINVGYLFFNDIINRHNMAGDLIFQIGYMSRGGFMLVIGINPIFICQDWKNQGFSFKNNCSSLLKGCADITLAFPISKNKKNRFVLRYSMHRKLFGFNSDGKSLNVTNSEGLHSLTVGYEFRFSSDM